MANEKRLIDANALGIGRCNPDLLPFGNRPYAAGWNGVVNIIDNAPTVDAVEVVHAEWIDIRFDQMWRSMLATCSHCKVRGEVRVKSNECGFAVPDSNYCPNCGAKMDR